MIDSNENPVDRSPQIGDLLVHISAISGLPEIRRLTRCGKKIVSLCNPFFRWNRYGRNDSRRRFDAYIESGFYKLRVPQDTDIIIHSKGKASIIAVNFDIAVAMDHRTEQRMEFWMDELHLVKLYRDNRAIYRSES